MYKTTIKIDGMMCTMCEAHINEAIRKAFKEAKKVKSSHTKGESSFVSETVPNEEIIRAGIEETGYNVLSVSTEEYRRKLFG